MFFNFFAESINRQPEFFCIKSHLFCSQEVGFQHCLEVYNIFKLQRAWGGGAELLLFFLAAECQDELEVRSYNRNVVVVRFIAQQLHFFNDRFDLFKYFFVYGYVWALVYVIEKNTVTCHFFFMKFNTVKISVEADYINNRCSRALPLQKLIGRQEKKICSIAFIVGKIYRKICRTVKSYNVVIGRFDCF